ncbi:MAG: hypothetical protein EAZ99_00755 [Alphaproteobacteria bacterium]|nr:MAG: hypothetical protein EAZ99_00755 [Alphaproteobacteria bacterium]
MRLERLLLSAYGGFTDRVLDLGPPGRLVLVVGRNEAGKSTTLQAIEDLLFGFPKNDDAPIPALKDRWRRQFLHRLDAVRVGAVVDGRTMFRRRTNRGPGWVGEDRQTPIEDPLGALLAGVDRALFVRLWSLDHQRLRAGAEELRANHGALGEALFAATTGATRLRRARQSLRDQADKLWKPRAQNPVVNALLKELAEQKKARRDEALSITVYDRLVRQQADAKAEAARLIAASDAVASQIATLDRVYQAIPLVQDWLNTQAELERLGDVPALPPDAAEQRARAQQQREGGLIRLQEAHRTLGELERALAALPPPDSVSGDAASVTTLLARCNPGGDIAKARADLPRRRGEWQETQRSAQDLAHRLGVVELPAMLPEADLLDAEALLARHERLEAGASEITTRLSRLVEEVAAAQQALARLPASPPTDALEAAVDAARSAGDLDARAEAAAREADRTAELAARALAAVPGWQDGIEALAHLALPLPAVVEAAKLALAAADPAPARRRLEDLIAERRDIERALLDDQELADPARLHRVRAHRDRALAAALADPVTAGAAALDAVAVADAEADRAISLAEHAGRHRAILARRTAVAAQETAAAAQLAAIESTAAAADAAWHQELVRAGLPPLSPAAFGEWQQVRRRALEAADLARAAATEAVTLAQQRRAALTQLIEALEVEPGPGASVARLIAEAQRRIKLAQQTRQQRDIAEANLASQQRQLAQADSDAAVVASHRRDWQAAWSTVMQRLSQPADRTPDGARAMLTAWREVATVRKHLADQQHRITQMEADEAAWAAEVAALALRHGEVASTPADHTIRRLAARLEAATAVEQSRTALLADQRRHHSAITRAQEDVAGAEATLSALLQAAGVATLAALPEVEQRAARLASVRERLAVIEQGLSAIDPQRSLAEIVQATEGQDPDTVAQRLTVLRAEKDRLGQAWHQATTHAAQLDAERAHLDRATGASLARQDYELTLARLGEEAQRAAVALMAAGLLERALRRQADQHQAPLLVEASRLFQALTVKRWHGIVVEAAESGELALAAAPAEGDPVAMQALSDGTRDQVFLALRLAALAQRPQPLPFLADDIFVQFDDERTAAGLAVLGEVALSRQVLVFTHHPHLAELASRTLGPTGVTRIDL